MLCPNTMPHDRECEPSHVSESHAGSCASTNQTSTITAVSAIPIPYQALHLAICHPVNVYQGWSRIRSRPLKTPLASSQRCHKATQVKGNLIHVQHRTRGVLMPNIITKHHRLRFTVHYTPLLTRYKVTFMNLYQAQILTSTPLPATK